MFTVKCSTKFVNSEFLSKVTNAMAATFRDELGNLRKWKSMKVCWLLANTENERTLIAVAE